MSDSSELATKLLFPGTRNVWKTGLETHGLLILLTLHNQSAQEVAGESVKKKLARNNNEDFKNGALVSSLEKVI